MIAPLPSGWSVTPSGWVMALSGGTLAALGAVSGYVEFVVLGATCLMAVLLALLHIARRTDMQANRTIAPMRVREGEAAVAELTISNRAHRRSPPVIAIEAVASQRIGVSLPSLRPGDELTARYRLPSGRRGVFLVGPLTLARSDPLRLVRRTTEDPSRPELMVVPRAHPVEPVPSGQSQDMDGPTIATSPQGGVAFHSVREYVPGDDVRLIHWGSTARVGELMVRHNVVPHVPRALVVLDTDQSAYEGDAFEDAVRMVASMCVATCENGAPVRLRCTSRPGDAVDASPLEGPKELLDRLAAVQVEADDPGVVSVPGAVQPEDGAALVAVTGQRSAAGPAVLGGLRQRFSFVAVVRLGTGGRPAQVPGVIVVDGETSAVAAAAWNRRVRR